MTKLGKNLTLLERRKNNLFSKFEAVGARVFGFTQNAHGLRFILKLGNKSQVPISLNSIEYTRVY